MLLVNLASHPQLLNCYQNIENNVNKRRNSQPVFIIYANHLLITCAFHLKIYNIFIFLIKLMSTKPGGSDDLFLFTYANHLLITCFFRFNIQYLFIYLFKVMSTKAGGSDNQCRQKQRKSPPVFIYLWKLLVDYMWFSF